MEFKVFKQNLVEWMNEHYENISFSTHDVIKNNGLHLTGICGLAQGSNISPNIYINDLYDSVIHGEMTFSAAATILEQRYKMACEGQTLPKVIDLLDYEKVKENLTARIVNRKLNEEILEQAPHKILGSDLAVTYRYLNSKDEQGIASALIHNTEFEAWNISLDELHEIALANTERIFPARINSLADVVKEYMREQVPAELSDILNEDFDMEDAAVQMYVVTNDVNLNGATAILYPTVQQYISERFGENVYILPSSIHECMLTIAGPEDEMFLKDMVSEANQTAVGLQDYLSDSIYKIKDGGLENVNPYELQIDQALDEIFNEAPEEDFGIEP